MDFSNINLHSVLWTLSLIVATTWASIQFYWNFRTAFYADALYGARRNQEGNLEQYIDVQIINKTKKPQYIMAVYIGFTNGYSYPVSKKMNKLLDAHKSMKFSIDASISMVTLKFEKTLMQMCIDKQIDRVFVISNNGIHSVKSNSFLSRVSGKYLSKFHIKQGIQK